MSFGRFFSVLITLLTSESWATDPHASLNLGLNFFQSSSRSNMSGMGQFILFQADAKGKWFRPNFGAQLEFATGTTREITGLALFGFELTTYGVPYVTPFLGPQVTVGWAHLLQGTEGNIGVLYGGTLGGGAEIRFSKKENASAFRIRTGWRLLSGSVGSVSGAELSSIQLCWPDLLIAKRKVP